MGAMRSAPVKAGCQPATTNQSRARASNRTPERAPQCLTDPTSRCRNNSGVQRSDDGIGERAWSLLACDPGGENLLLERDSLPAPLRKTCPFGLLPPP